MKNTNAVVFCTYPRSFGGDFNKNFLAFKNQNFDNFFVCFDDQSKKHNTEEAYLGVPVVDYNLSDFEALDFMKPIDPKHRWGSHQNPNYFYAHFRMMLFYTHQPYYDYYWFFDDDVTFTGNLKPLLSAYENANLDFVAVQAFKKEDYDDKFPYVSKADTKMGSAGHWLGFAPGPGDKYKSTEKHFGSFFPIVGFSRPALEHMWRVHYEGYYGYSEGFVPTTLASDGFSVGSMLNNEDKFFIEPETDCKLFHKHTNFSWTWI